MALRRNEISSADPEELFEMMHIVGEGSFGLICACKSNADGKVYAIKFLETEDGASDEAELQKEIDLLNELKDSDYVVKFYGSYFKDSTLLLVMEFCDGGSALDIIQKAEHKFSEKEAAAILHDMLQGLSYLHGNKVMHRDIKAANVLLSRDGVAKLADFGVSAKLNYTMQRRGTIVGSPYWMAPEVIKADDEDEGGGGYNFNADVWSTGITAIELVDGEPPLFKLPALRVIFMIPSRAPPTFAEPTKWSANFIAFVEACLQKDPNQRKFVVNLLKDKTTKTTYAPYSAFIRQGREDHGCLRVLMDRVVPILQEKRAQTYAEGDEELKGKSLTVSGDKKTIGTFSNAAWSTFVVNSGNNTGRFGGQDDE